jgi:hypothetical protein
MHSPCGVRCGGARREQKFVMRARKALTDRDTHTVLRHLDAAHELYAGDLEATVLKVGNPHPQPPPPTTPAPCPTPMCAALATGA